VKAKTIISFAGIGDISKKDGLTQLLKKVFALLLVYENFKCYLYKNSLTNKNEVDFLPAVKGFSLKIVSTKQQIDELINDGFDLLTHSIKAKYRLEKGAVACLVFMDKELASMEWVATSTEAKASIDNYPCATDFKNKEAYAGGVWTNPKHRGHGLHTYAYYKIYDFLRETGIDTVKSIVEVNNAAAIKSHDKFAPEEKVYGKACYFRAAGIQFWKESPLKPNNNCK
jgi:hypothetical protein